MAKVHFKTDNGTACGRPAKFADTSVWSVSCLNCQKQQEFITARTAAVAGKAEAFLAQTPRQFAEPWKDGTITCDVCLGTMFREGNRTCYGHYANYVCAGCGSNQSRLTETGMSF